MLWRDLWALIRTRGTIESVHVGAVLLPALLVTGSGRSAITVARRAICAVGPPFISLGSGRWCEANALAAGLVVADATGIARVSCRLLVCIESPSAAIW